MRKEKCSDDGRARMSKFQNQLIHDEQVKTQETYTLPFPINTFRTLHKQTLRYSGN